MSNWSKLTVDERKMLHQIYDHAPETPWDDIFLRFSMTHLTENTQLIHGVVPYAKYKMPLKERLEFCKSLLPKLVSLGLIFPDGQAGRRGSVTYSGKGARLTDQGWACLGSPGSAGHVVDFYSNESPRPTYVGTKGEGGKETECLGCGKAIPLNNQTFGFAVCSAECKEKRIAATLSWMTG
jgi:hypothetical protein